jgi:AraC family transcriptional regulator
VNRLTVLHETTDLTVRQFDHPPHEAHEDPEREIATGWSIAFVRRGTFDIMVGRVRHRLVPGSLFLNHPGLAFRCSHGASCPDDVCLSVAFEPAAMVDEEDGWLRAGWSARVAPTPRLAFVHRRLAAAADRGDTFETERWALAALRSLSADRGAYSARARDLDAVVATCRAIEADPAARLSVAQRARDVGLTGTRLTHGFRRYLGMSPHRYVVRWRLAAAAQLLEAGQSVSDGCYRSGFENLSHFCRTFQRALGVRPSAWRAVPPRETRRKVQDLLRVAS